MRDEFGLRPRLMTITEVAAFLNVTEIRVRQWTRRGHLTPAGRHGGRPYYLETDLFPVERALRQNPDTPIGRLLRSA